MKLALSRYYSNYISRQFIHQLPAQLDYSGFQLVFGRFEPSDDIEGHATERSVSIDLSSTSEKTQEKGVVKSLYSIIAIQITAAQ